MQSRLDEIQQVGAVFGLSADSPFSLAKWAKEEGYTFPLLSDFDKETIQAYDTMYPERIALKGVPKRSAFLIDREGILVRQEISEDTKVLPDLDGFIDQMKRL